MFQRLQSPIHIVAEMGHKEICEMLLAAGANIEQREQVNYIISPASWPICLRNRTTTPRLAGNAYILGIRAAEPVTVVKSTLSGESSAAYTRVSRFRHSRTANVESELAPRSVATGTEAVFGGTREIGLTEADRSCSAGNIRENGVSPRSNAIKVGVSLYRIC